MKFWNRWFDIACGLTVLIGVVMVPATLLADGAVMASLMDMLWWNPRPESGLSASTALLSGVAAGIMAGFGLLGLLLSRAGLVRDNTKVRSALALSLGLWFVLDSTVSVLTGALWNVDGNLLFLASWLVPLYGMHRAARKEGVLVRGAHPKGALA